MTNVGNDQQSQALAPIANGGSPLVLGSDAYRGGLEPSTLNDAYQLAQMIASTGICGVTTPEDALIRMLTGRSLGLSAMQSLRGVYIVKGRPSLDASLMQALCMKSPVCEYFECVSTDETQATYRTKRKGRPERVLTYTIEDADRQGLVQRGKDDAAKEANNYDKIPKEMLRARAKSTLARIEYPDLMFGMYSREELEAGVDVDGTQDVAGLRSRIQAQEVEVEVVPAPASPVQAAARDFAKEADTLIERVKAAGASRQLRAEARSAIEAWDAPEQWKARVSTVYNETRPRRANGEATQEGGAPAAAAAAPATVGDANLFTGAEPKK